MLQEEGHVGVFTVLREAHFVVGVGDAALTRPGRTISLGEGIAGVVHKMIPVYLVSFYLK